MEAKDIINKLKEYIDANDLLDDFCDYLTDEEIKDICDEIIVKHNIDTSDYSFYEEYYEE